MEEYHGIVIHESQKYKSIFKNLRILGERIAKDEKRTLYKIAVGAEGLENTILFLQNNMLPGYYFHLYRNGELIVAFKEKIFRINTDKSTWKEAIEYGKSLGIPENQLDFFPCHIEDETY